MSDRYSRRRAGAVIHPAKSTAIFATIVFGVFIAAITGYGLIQTVIHMVNGDVPALGYLVMKLVLAPVAASAVFACFARPAWGLTVVRLFSVCLTAFVLWVAATPNPHPVFAIQQGAEEVGAQLAPFMMAAGLLVYLWAIWFGRRVRAYFAPAAPATVARVDTLERAE